MIWRKKHITNYDFENTVFSYIPNTAEVSFFGMVKAAHKALSAQKAEKIKELSDSIEEKTFRWMELGERT